MSSCYTLYNSIDCLQSSDKRDVKGNSQQSKGTTIPQYNYIHSLHHRLPMMMRYKSSKQTQHHV